MPYLTTTNNNVGLPVLYPISDTGSRQMNTNKADSGVNEPVAALYFVLNGRLNYQLEGLGEFSLSAGQYNIIFPPLEAWPNEGKYDVGIFAIHFPIPYLLNLNVSFPALSFFLDKAQKGISCKLSITEGIADSRMITLIGNIRECSYTTSLKKTYQELQISTLLIIALSRIAGQPSRNKQEIVLKPLDIERIKATRKYLLQNMEQPPTLIELAHKMGLNDFKLKKGYKQVYGMTIFDDFLHARMKKASRLLTETSQSIVAIAELTGYKNVSSFSVAFKQYFDHSPGWLRKIV
jgi:AraC family transcriptional regulator, transcriptional activator of the genes for pyochelin and ferripyochelin receptors